MIDGKDIQAIGSLNLGERKSLGVGVGNNDSEWDEFVNLRLKQDGGYTYWKPRGGTVDQGLSVANHKQGFFFKARVGEVVKEYLARQFTSGNVTIYEYPSFNEIKTISGFTTTGKVQFAPIGELLYMFDGNQSKYINLRSEVVSDYLSTRSGDIIGYTEEVVQSATGLFPISQGDRAIVFPPDITSFASSPVKYKAGVNERGRARSDYTFPDFAEYTYIELNNLSPFSEEKWIVIQLSPGHIYKFTPGFASSNIGFDFQNVEYSFSDESGAIYFSVDAYTQRWQIVAASDAFTVPDLKQIDSNLITSTNGFYKSRLGTVENVDGDLGFYADNGDLISLSNDKFSFIGYNESLESLIGINRYEIIESTDVYSTYNDNGYKLPTIQSESGNGKTLYRSYIFVDILDDGSISIPGRPISVSRELYSDVIGVTLNVTPAADNVAKRYLCGSKYLKSDKKIFLPRTDPYSNTTWYIIREVSKGDDNVFDSFTTDDLSRPIEGILPMANGIPTIFGNDQLIPQTISPYKDIFVIGGYTINRPLPGVYFSADDYDGNIYVDQTGTDTTNTCSIQFEYTDGKFSNTTNFTVKDGGAKAIIHSLNTLVSKVHVYMDDGTNTYEVKTITHDDPEFMGYPFDIPISFTGFSPATIETDVQESVILKNYVTVPVPPQQIFISAQAKSFGNSNITGTVPLDYDIDKTTLRYKILVFTEDNLQLGYITEVPNDSNISYSVDFELFDESRRAISRDSIFRVGSSTFFQDSNGVHAVQGTQINKVIPKERFDFLSDPLTSVVFNEKESELWFLFGGSLLYVLDADDGYRSTYNFDGLSIIDAQWFNNTLYVLTDDKLCITDKEGTATDLGDDINSTAISRYIGDQRLQTILHEVIIYGIGGSISLSLDEGLYRYEENSSSPSSFNFSESDNFGQIGNELYGALFTPRSRGIRQRIKLDMTGDFTIEDIEIKLSTLANEGVARIEP